MIGWKRQPDAWPRLRVALVNTFLVFHLVAVAAWLAPAGWWPRDQLVVRVGPYLRALGLAQRWAMFAPNPPRANPKIAASLRFADGSERTWQLPPLEGSGHLVRSQKWRYRRWAWDLVLRDQPGAWADAARWAVLTHGMDPANPAVAVAVTCRLVPIPPPGSPPGAAGPGREAIRAAFDVRPGGAP